MMKITDIVPPILMSLLRAARVSLRGKPKSASFMGRQIEHRGSDADLGVIDQVIYRQDYSFNRLRRKNDIRRLYERMESPLIIDAGANIGASSVWFSLMFPKATIAAVEPHPENFKLLEKNVAGLKVRAIHGALASSEGSVKLYDPGEGEWGFRTGDSVGLPLGEVLAFTVENLVKRGDTPFILKIDIEGGEAGLFDSGAFDNWPIIVIELHDWMLPKGGTSRSFLRWHASQDRDFVYIGENVFSISNRI